jgi:hypothetical protein
MRLNGELLLCGGSWLSGFHPPLRWRTACGSPAHFAFFGEIDSRHHRGLSVRLERGG